MTLVAHTRSPSALSWDRSSSCTVIGKQAVHGVFTSYSFKACSHLPRLEHIIICDAAELFSHPFTSPSYHLHLPSAPRCISLVGWSAPAVIRNGSTKDGGKDCGSAGIVIAPLRWRKHLEKGTIKRRIAEKNYYYGDFPR